VSHVKNASQKDAATLWPVGARCCTVNRYGTESQYCTDKFPPLEYLEADHITVEALGLSRETAEALGIWISAEGLDERLVAIRIRLPTCELTGYVGISEAKLPKSFTFPTWSHLPRRVRKKSPANLRGLLFTF